MIVAANVLNLVFGVFLCLLFTMVEAKNLAFWQDFCKQFYHRFPKVPLFFIIIDPGISPR